MPFIRIEDSPLLHRYGWLQQPFCNVETKAGPTADGDITESIHASLASQNLLPSKHIVDTGYLDAELLVQSQEQYQVELVGPTRSNHQWQLKEAKGFAADDFNVD